MEKKSVYSTIDGRRFDVLMSWNENIKESDHIFAVKFKVTDQVSGRPLKLPREIETFAYGDPAESVSARATAYYGGSREMMIVDYLESAYRRACDYVERGK
jgi:hypothetical protein